MALALCACSDADPGAGFTYVGRVTIERGIYGRLFWGNDMSGACYFPTTPLQLEIYPGAAQDLPRGPVAGQATNGDEGFFQIPLPDGQYFICPHLTPGTEACDLTTGFEISASCPLARLEYADHLWDSLSCAAPGPSPMACAQL